MCSFEARHVMYLFSRAGPTTSSRTALRPSYTCTRRHAGTYAGVHACTRTIKMSLGYLKRELEGGQAFTVYPPPAFLHLGRGRREGCEGGAVWVWKGIRMMGTEGEVLRKSGESVFWLLSARRECIKYE